MKMHRLIFLFFAFFLFASLLTACQKNQRIESNQIEKIVAWTHNTAEYTLSEDDFAKFIELYNAAQYGGKATGEGGTPDFGIIVYFSDGTYLRVNDFYGKLEVGLDKGSNKEAWYYISSNELYTFMAELANKIDK